MKKAVFTLTMLLCTAGMAMAVITSNWSGNVSTAWNTSGNWTNSNIPDNLKSGATDVYKAYFGQSPARECALSYEGPAITNLHADAGQTKPLRIVNGGHLTVLDWAIIGYSAANSKVVVDGGVLDCQSHLLIGCFAVNYNSANGSSFEQNGGVVNVSGVFGPGFYSGRGRYQLNGGILNANGNWDMTNGGGIGTMDITNGVFIKSGDATGMVSTEVTAGRLTAFGGEGKIKYDYNVTNVGKTTVTAIPKQDGDIDGDNDVDIDDLVLFASEWLNPTCGNKADFTENCKVNYQDFITLAENWLEGIRTYWHVVTPQYSTDEVIITPHYAEDFGIVADGVTDVTDAIQSALTSVSNLGGGALFLPAGNYKVSGTLTIPSRVILRGDWQQPVIGSPIQGTILQAYAGRGSETGAPFIGLSNSSGIKGIAIWYPEQLPANIQPYPPTVQRIAGGNQTIENVTFVNSYFGFTTYNTSTTACPFVRNVYGTPLKTGIELDCLADIGRIETVHFSPDYWKYSGLSNAPTANEHALWIYNNGTGVLLRRIDWSYSAYVTVEKYNIGLALRPSRYDGVVSNGQCYDFNLQNCKIGVYVENSSYAGFLFTRFDIQQAETGIHFGTSTAYPACFHTCSINASNSAVLNEGSAKVQLQNCNIQRGKVQINGGYLTVVNSDFGSTTTSHITLGSSVRGASILSNRFTGSPVIVNNTTYPVYINHTPLTVASLPAYDYKKPTQVFTAAKSNLFVVTQYPYYAKADGITDDTAAFQTALAAAEANGGGIVFVPGGDYRLNGNLTVPTGVELRGIFDIPHSTSARGSVLNICAGRNQETGTPFIQIESGAGIRGLTFHYPEQIYNASDTVNYGMVPYPFMIRGLGSDIYAINLAATIPYQLLDLATYKCDRHYVDYILSTALLTGIHVGGGSVDGQVHNCQFNPSAYTHQAGTYASIPSNAADGIHAILWRQSRPYLFGNMSGEVLHQNFVFGGLYGVHLVKEDGAGPSGCCMGMGVDQCTNALQIDDVGTAGLDFINTQLVTVNGTIGRYVETGASFTDTFRMFSAACWGTNERSVVVNGGRLELQLFHIARDAETVAYDVRNTARLSCIGGDVTDYLTAFLQIQPTAAAEFIANIINTSAAQMPVNTTNVTSIGNLRVQ